MAQPTLLIKNLLDATREEYFYHKDRVNKLKLKDYPFTHSQTILRLLSNIDIAILSELDKVDSEILGNLNTITINEAIDKIKRYGQLVEILHKILSFFEMGSREYIPQGTLVSIKKIMNKIDRFSAFSLVPIFEYNYNYVELMAPLISALKYALPDTKQLFSGMPENFAIFGFPLVMKNNVLLNVILAHEIGHFVDFRAKFSERILERVVLDKEKMERYALSVEKSQFGERKDVKLTYFITPETLRAEITNAAVKRISEWLQELISDLIAFHCCGPVFLQSLSEILLIMVDLDEASTDHPPPRLRINLLLDEFEEMGYYNILKSGEGDDGMKQFIGLFSDLKKTIGKISLNPVEGFEDLVIASVEKVIPLLKEKVREFTKDFAYTPDKFNKDAPKLTQCLDSVVPPAETDVGKPSDHASIINTGALYKTTQMQKLYEIFRAKTSTEKIEVRDKLHSLILKALELSDIGERMKEAQRG